MASDAELQFLKKIIASSQKFSFDLYQLLAEKHENIFYSPISVYLALMLTYIGANGKTAEEIKKYLNLTGEKDKILQGVRLLLDHLKCPELNTATEIFIENTYGVRQDYKDIVKKYLDSESKLVNFKTDSRAAEEYINSWVSTQTKEKIKNLIPSGTLNEDTKLVLVNAIHFKDAWFHKFNKSMTCQGTFHITKEHSVEIPMMKITENFNFVEKDDIKILELQYKNRDFRMIIVLPHEIEGLSKLQNKFDISDVLQDLRSAKVRVILPKFKLEQFINLNDSLKKIGIETMFTNEADFAGIYVEKKHPLYVSSVLHKAFVEVNEEGTEAAAATACILMKRSLIVEEIYEFVVDHRFIFYIMKNDIVLFSGQIESF